MSSWSERLRGSSGAAPKQPRTAVLSPSPSGWLGLEQVRGLRVVAHDGAVVVHRADGSTQRVAERGTVTRLSLVTGAALALVGGAAGTHGLLVLHAGERPLLALWVGHWIPGPAHDLTDAQARALSGVDALARELSLPVEPADTSVLQRTAAEVRAVTVTPEPARTSLAARVAPVLLALWGIGFFAFGIVGAVVTNLGDGDRTLVLPAPFAWFGVLVAVALLVSDAVASRQARALQRTSPALAAGAWAPHPSGPVPAGFLRQARLLVSAQELVVRDADGREAWLPGPARGGVNRVALTGEAVVLLDGAGAEMLALDEGAWAGAPGAGDELAALFQAAGVAPAEGLVARLPLFARPVVTGPQTLPWLGDRRESTGLASTNLRVAAAAVAVVAGLFCLTLGGVLGSDSVRSGPASVNVLLGGLGVLAGVAQAGLGTARSRRDRAARRLAR